VYGFRGDAFAVIMSGPVSAPLARAASLVGVAVGTGLVLLFLWFLLSLRRLSRERPVLTLATLAVLLVASVSLALGGSYWRPYLFELLPAAVLSLALLASATSATPATVSRPARSRVVTTAVVAVLVASSVVDGARFVQSWPSRGRAGAGVVIGRSLLAASQPGDTLAVWGGQANVQLASGLASPYEHLWSLPARTRDPGSTHLAAVLAGPHAPTWFLTWSDLDAWEDDTPAAVEPVLRARYVKAAEVCGGHELYRLRTARRPTPAVSCAAIAAARAGTAP
jgi:hypothetical protein